jgi:hypothetical protein
MRWRLYFYVVPVLRSDPTGILQNNILFLLNFQVLNLRFVVFKGIELKQNAWEDKIKIDKLCSNIFPIIFVSECFNVLVIDNRDCLAIYISSKSVRVYVNVQAFYKKKIIYYSTI